MLLTTTMLEDSLPNLPFFNFASVREKAEANEKAEDKRSLNENGEVWVSGCDVFYT